MMMNIKNYKLMNTILVPSAKMKYISVCLEGDVAYSRYKYWLERAIIEAKEAKKYDIVLKRIDRGENITCIRNFIENKLSLTKTYKNRSDVYKSSYIKCMREYGYGREALG